MNWPQLAEVAVGIVTGFGAGASASMAKSAGADLYNWLKSKLVTSVVERKALTRVVEEPDSNSAKAELLRVIEERATAEPQSFGSELRSQIDRLIDADSSTRALVNQIVAGKVTVVDKVIGNIYM